MDRIAVAIADVICDDLMRLSTAEAPMAVVASPGVVLCRLNETPTVKDFNSVELQTLAYCLDFLSGG